MPISYFDIIISVFLLFFVYRGFMNGLLVELASILGLILGFFLAGKYTTTALPYIETYVPPNISFPVTYAAIVILVVVLTGLVARLLDYVLSLALIGWLNSLLGALFGLVKGALIVTGIIFVTTDLLQIRVPAINDSIYTPYYLKGAQFFESFTENLQWDNYHLR